MKKNSAYLLFLLAFFLSFPSLSETLPPLNIAAETFAPPFVMRGMHNQLYGFDIDMMEHICKMLKRRCVYQPTRFEDLLQKVESGQAEVAVGAITITLERAKSVSFSIPYLLSYAQYITLKGAHPEKFTIQSLANHSVGVEEGSIFRAAVNESNIKNVKIVEFKNLELIIDALQSEKIDYAIVDSSTAQYWKMQSNEKIAARGKPFLYGYGFGIAMNIKNQELLEQINSALLEYQNNGGFQKAYNQYIAQF